MNTSTIPVSVIVLTYNEEANIAACLDSIIDWAGEIFVVDSGSDDRTLEIVGQYTQEVVIHPFKNYSHQRNWAQSHLPLHYEWVFHIDADERVTPELVDALQAFWHDGHQEMDVAGLLVRRRIEFLGRYIKHGGIYPTYHCRVFKRSRGRCEDREYDQHFIVEGSTIRLEADLIEITASSLASWTTRHNRWAQMEALHLFYRTRHSPSPNQVTGKVAGTPIERRRWLRARVYEKLPLFGRAFAYFLVRYFLRGGFLDGIPGLIYHVLHGFWFRFYTDSCLYERMQEFAENE